MDGNRRDFLKIAGLSLLGLGVKPLEKALATQGQQKFAPNAKALTAVRWAMVVNLKQFKVSGPKALQVCIDACHQEHNVPEFDNAKDAIKWIWKEKWAHAFPSQEHKHLEEFVKDGMNGMGVPVLCNHCENPPCVRVCPTKATFKREEDGLVLMDFHRCIGCRYCMAACPYGSRSFNWRDPRPHIKKTLNREYPTRTRGVVEKCNFCAERLAKGLKPACVEACKNKELVFGDLEDPNSEVRGLLKKHFNIRRKPQLGTQPQIYYIV